jgi:hypothetical protein
LSSPEKAFLLSTALFVRDIQSVTYRLYWVVTSQFIPLKDAQLFYLRVFIIYSTAFLRARVIWHQVLDDQ